MYPQKSNARRGYAERERKRKIAREQAASEWQPVVFPEEKMNTNWKSIIIVALVCTTVLCLGACIISGYAGNIFSRPTAEAPVVVDPTEAPVVVDPTETPVVVDPTEAPVVVEPTQAPPIPVNVTCDTPFIDASLDGSTYKAMGIFLDTILGKRMTYTSRSLLIPEKEWNVELTSTELKTVEETWQTISVCVPEGMYGRIFAGGYEQKIQRYENGALLSLKPGLYEFNLRNAEIVIWYPQQDSFSASDLERIIDQIKYGNFDIKGELALFGVTSDMFSKIPNDLVKQNNVQIVPYPDPVVK